MEFNTGTIWQINMEPENDGFFILIFLFNWVVSRFQPLILQGLIQILRFFWVPIVLVWEELTAVEPGISDQTSYAKLVGCEMSILEEEWI